MTIKKCSVCGSKTRKNGKTSAGKQRWRCTSCNVSKSHKINSDAKALKEFLDWLLSRRRQADLPGGGRSFRRVNTKFWKMWPLPPLVDEIHRVIYVDGIYLNRNTVVLIACSKDYVLGWYLAQSENSRAWQALLSRIAAPDMVITDGGQGFKGACMNVWPHTKIQRCRVHVFRQVRRCTTSRPKLDAGRELYALAGRLLHVDNIEKAQDWMFDYDCWLRTWDDFLKEMSDFNNRREYTHKRLRRARGSLNKLVRQGTLFTFLDPSLTRYGPLPASNNLIEGKVNAALRHMLRDHRGLSLIRRIKAVFWWCYLHTEDPLPHADMLKEMPTDDDVDALFFAAAERQKMREILPGLGTAIVWSDLHLSGPERLEWS